MKTRHWSDDELIDELYGVGPGDGHLGECEECQTRRQRLQAARERTLEPVAVSEEFLSRQRRAFHQRLEKRERAARWYRLAPAALATAAVVVLAVALYRPAPAPVAEPNDAQLFAESYSMVASDEPEAVQWVHGLFETEGMQ